VTTRPPTQERTTSTTGPGAAAADAPTIPASPDEDLAARVAARDVAAFAALYDRYARPVYALCAHLLGPADAEEAVQEIFLVLWQRADRYDPARGPFRPWFVAVARHHALRELRRRGPERQTAAASEVERVFADAADGRVDVEDAAWRREEDAAVRRALAALPPEQRRALVLAYFGGLSQAAIARHLGWPLGTVKKRTRLGLHKLRAALGAFAPTASPPPNRPAASVGRAAPSPPAHAFTSEQDDNGL
jgi:RNA polymerase sigma-70 factor (ECF subfamily)